MNHNILIVEDDLISANYLKKICTKSNFIVTDIVTHAEDALNVMKSKDISLILMDIMIDGSISGCELAMKIRSFNQKVVIIFITAYTSEEMIQYALDTKAYSYLLKPYRDVEIMSTIQMALNVRVSKPIQSNNFIECKNDFKLDVKTHKLYHNSQELFLSEKLHQLLQLFIQNKGSCVSYEEITATIYDGLHNINTIRSNTHRLKTKLPDLELHSVSKTGYVLY